MGCINDFAMGNTPFMVEDYGFMPACITQDRLVYLTTLSTLVMGQSSISI